MATNSSIFAAFERLWMHVVNALSGKADSTHNHDSTYVKTTQTLTVTGVDEDGTTHTWTMYGVKQ
jgi:hypothetical protein